MPALKTQVVAPILGLDVSRPGEFIDARSTSNCQNVEIKRGVIQQRQGGIALGSSMTERIMAMAELESGINTYLFRVGPTKVEVYNKSTGVWSSVANTALTATEEDQVNFAFPLISAVRYAVFTNGSNNIRKVNSGVDADLGGSPPKAKFVLDFGGYLLLGNVTDSGTNYFLRVQWSDTGNAEAWTGGNSGSQDLLEDNLAITGMHVFGNYVAVHKESAIWLGQLVTSADTFIFSRKETGSGTIAHKSIQNLPSGEQIFLSRDGIRIFNGVTSSLIDSPIIDELRDSMSPQYAYLAESVLVKDLDEYWVAVPIGNDTYLETIYKYNYRTGQVYRDDRANLTALGLSRRTDQASWDSDSETWDSDTTRWDSVTDLALHRQVVFGDVDGNASMRTSSANDVSTAIDSFWDSKDFTILDVDPSKPIGTLIRWDKIEMWAKGDSLTAYYSTDSGMTWNLISSLTLSSDYPSDDDPDFLYFDKLSSKMRFRFRNSTASQSWTMKQFWISVKPREVRK